jgi:hypothetical protein
MSAALERIDHLPPELKLNGLLMNGFLKMGLQMRSAERHLVGGTARRWLETV